MKQEEIREIWEWCGVKPKTRWDISCEEELYYPRITLDNLFKYAVPKLGYGKEILLYQMPSIKPCWCCWLGHFQAGKGTVSEATCRAETPAEALAQAILKLIRAEK